jgi:hypothetical protein
MNYKIFAGLEDAVRFAEKEIGTNVDAVRGARSHNDREL